MSAETQRITDPQQAIASWNKDSAAFEQKRLEKVYQVGEFSPYSKEVRPIRVDALRDASYEWINNPADFIRNFSTHVRNIDRDFRGGRDIGGLGERAERVATYASVIAMFTAFDYATSMAIEKFFPLMKGTEENPLKPDDVRKNAVIRAFRKLGEVMNDKYATALGNMYVENKTGKRGYIHEVADKGADTLQVGWGKLNDMVNGATLESYMRIASQVPVAGALFEQAVTRLSRWQEKSSLHTATGKMIYMAAGVLIQEQRKAGIMEAEDVTEIVARSMV